MLQHLIAEGGIMQPTPEENEMAEDLASITDELDREVDPVEVPPPVMVAAQAEKPADADNYADGSDPAIDDLDPDEPKDLLDLLADGAGASAAADASSATAAAADEEVRH
jgi:hypothetical protein